MSEEVLDNLDNEAQQDGSAPDKDKADNSVLGNFETPEQLAKAYKELQHKLGEQGNELGQLREKVKSRDTESKLAEVLERVASSTKKDEPAFDYEAWAGQISADMVEDPKAATKKLLATVNSWMIEDREKTKGYTEQKVKELEGNLSQMRDLMETMTDDYKENKVIIDKLRAKGMSIADAKKLAKDLVESTVGSQRVIPSSGVTPTRTVQTQAKKEPVATQEEIDRLIAEYGLDDDGVQTLLANWERDRNLTDAERKRF